MHSRHITTILLAILLLSTVVLAKGIEIGKPAPNFSLEDVSGKAHKLSDYKDKYVVLEWVNFDCPFVKKHYNSGNMQMLQKKYTEKDVIWLSINSSAPGKQGNFSSEEIVKRSSAHKAAPTAYLIDEKGRVGKWYGAKTTPHMFIIDPKGNVIYAGAIDDTKSVNVDDVPESKNYVSAALDAALDGKPVEVSRTKPYGCSVKY